MYKLFSNFSTLSGLVTEMIQATGDVGTQCILDLCRPNSVVKEGCILEDWKSRGVVLPIYKGKVTQWIVDLIEGLHCWNMLQNSAAD